MYLTACPHCGTSLPLTHDAFCPECRNDLGESPFEPANQREPAASKFGPPLKEIRKPSLAKLFAGVGLIAGVANGVRMLGHQGGVAQVAGEDPGYLIGYLLGSSLMFGLVGLAIGVIVGQLVRLFRRFVNPG